VDEVEREEQEQLDTAISDLVDQGHVEGAAAGIAKLYLEKGRNALSEKQEAVFKNQILSLIEGNTCKRCHQAIPISEVVESLDNGGVCGYCENMEAKDD
jgi:hypothetical protein